MSNIYAKITVVLVKMNSQIGHYINVKHSDMGNVVIVGGWARQAEVHTCDQRYLKHLTYHYDSKLQTCLPQAAGKSELI